MLKKQSLFLSPSLSLFRSLADNRITELPNVLCDDDDEFMDGLVGELDENKCDAILCPPGTYSAVGRQTQVGVLCQECPGETELEKKEQAPFYGQLKCKRISEERKILEELHGLIFTGKICPFHRCVCVLLTLN